MFNKIIKRTSRKPPKSDLSLFPPPPLPAINHSSRTTLSSSVTTPSTPPPVASSASPTLPSSTSSSPIAPLPLLRDASPASLPSLFLRKLQICALPLLPSDPPRDRETKRQTLLELLDFAQAQGRLPESAQEALVVTIGANLFRCLPPSSSQEPPDPEEDDPFFDPAWPHLQLVYELLLRYVVSQETDTKVAKRWLDHSFVLKLLELFNSEDPREREYLKTILHRIYGKFMVHRPFIRKAINNIFYRFVFETERHCGIGELLEILGSIINGFALPMKEEHKLFLVRTLIPLHKPKSIAFYHQQLSYCIVQFVEKDHKLADAVIRGLLRYWPLTNCQKEVLFLGELEEVLEATQPSEFQKCMGPLFRQIARCLNSSHFQHNGAASMIYLQRAASVSGAHHKANRINLLSNGGNLLGH